MKRLLEGLMLALMLCFATSAFAGTTSGTFVKIQDTGEGNVDFIIKNSNGKTEAFEFDVGGGYDFYKKWDKKSAKGTKVIVHWTDGGSGNYKFKILNKVELADNNASVGASSQVALADVSGEYMKKNGVVEVKQSGQMLNFSINSSVGAHVCNLDGAAIMIDAKRAAYTPDDKTNMCAAVLDFTGGILKLTTKDCDGFCGMNASGSMDGTYKKKGGKRK